MKNLWRWGEIDWDALARSMEKAGYEVNDYEDGTVTTSESRCAQTKTRVHRRVVHRFCCRVRFRCWVWFLGYALKLRKGGLVLWSTTETQASV